MVLTCNCSSCDSESGDEVTLAQEAAHSDDEHDDDAAAGGANATESPSGTPTEPGAAEASGDGAGSAVVASVGFSVVGLVLALFLL